MKKQLLILFAFISVLAFGQAPQRFNKVIVTGDITSPKFIKTGSNADSVLLGNGSARAISTIKIDTVSLSNRINAKSAGNGTANGTNTGDETLTSIKTKLGAATSVSDGYLKYQDWSIFNSKEPAITKNTAFNKNFGTTTGTVLEGRTFGTAAGSAVGDFIQNQNSSAQTANIWINGAGTFGGASASINAISTINTNNSTLSLGNAVGFTGAGAEGTKLYYSGSTGNTFLDSYYSNGKIYFRTNVSSGNPVNALMLDNSGTATFSSTVNSTGFLLNGNNLTSSLTTNYIPKWNGSNFVNSLISDDGVSSTFIGNTGQTSSFIKFRNSSNSGLDNERMGIFGNDFIMDNFNGTYNFRTTSSYTTRLSIANNGNISIPTTTPSTLPTTGALVVNGGVGADHVRANNFYGNGSNLTGVQLPITLTTNGTSGAATFSGNVLNIPNYASTGTGGEFTSNYTDISNTTLSTSTLAAYTNINGIINASVFGAVTSTASGKCTFRLSVPTVIRSGRCAVVSGVESGKTTSANIFIEGTGSTYVDISFIASTSSSILEFKMITMGY